MLARTRLSVARASPALARFTRPASSSALMASARIGGLPAGGSADHVRPDHEIKAIPGGDFFPGADPVDRDDPALDIPALVAPVVLDTAGEQIGALGGQPVLGGQLGVGGRHGQTRLRGRTGMGGWFWYPPARSA